MFRFPMSAGPSGWIGSDLLAAQPFGMHITCRTGDAMKHFVMTLATWLLLGTVGIGGELTGHKLLVTSVRTGDTEIFEVDPDLGDAKNLSRSSLSEDRYPCWSPDGKQIAFISDRDKPANLYVMK